MLLFIVNILIFNRKEDLLSFNFWRFCYNEVSLIFLCSLTKISVLNRCKNNIELHYTNLFNRSLYIFLTIENNT